MMLNVCLFKNIRFIISAFVIVCICVNVFFSS